MVFAARMARLVHYQFVEPWITGRSVLEVGAQDGVATDFLGRHARSVVAVGEQAQQGTQGSANGGQAAIRRLSGGIEHLSHLRGSFDAVLVPDMRTLEGAPSILTDVVRLCGDDGIALFSTPSDAHVVQLFSDYHGFRRILESHFATVRTFGLIPFCGYTVADFNPAEDLVAEVNSELVEQDEPPEHFLAICGSNSAEVPSYSIVQVPAFDFLDQDAELGPEEDTASLAGSLVAADEDLDESSSSWGTMLVNAQQQLGAERQRVDLERERVSTLQEKLAALRGDVEAYRVRAESAEAAHEQIRSFFEQQRVRAESAERRHDSLVAQLEKSAAELSRLHQRIGEVQAMRQAEQWKIDELQLQLRDAGTAAHTSTQHPRPTTEPVTSQRLDRAETRYREQSELATQLRQQLEGAKAENDRLRVEVAQLQQLAEQLRRHNAEKKQNARSAPVQLPKHDVTLLHKERSDRLELRISELNELNAFLQERVQEMRQQLASCEQRSRNERERAEKFRRQAADHGVELAKLKGAFRRLSFPQKR